MAARLVFQRIYQVKMNRHQIVSALPMISLKLLTKGKLAGSDRYAANGVRVASRFPGLDKGQWFAENAVTTVIKIEQIGFQEEMIHDEKMTQNHVSHHA